MGSSQYTIVVVGHDAGGAELLCAFVKEYLRKATWTLLALPDSPMEIIATREGLHVTSITNAAQQLEILKPDLLLFGTGWQAHTERAFVAYAKKHAITTVAFLDHWSNYRERFGFPDEGWEINLADFTAVHDKNALERAQNLQLPNPIALPNFYLQNLVTSIHTQPLRSQLLFLSEPTDAVATTHYGNPNYWGFTQYSALEMILNAFDRFECQQLVIRLHPSEKTHTYEDVLKKYPHIPFTISKPSNIPVNEEIMASKLTIGFDTMALYIAAYLHKPVISFLPSPKREFLLPLPQTHQLRNLDELCAFHLEPLELQSSDFGMDFASFIKTVQMGQQCKKGLTPQ